MILEGETELRLKARTKFEKYDKYSKSETNRFGIVKSEDQNMSPTKTTRQRSYNKQPIFSYQPLRDNGGATSLAQRKVGTSR